MSTPKKQKISNAVQQVELSDHSGDHAKLEDKLDKILEKVNEDSKESHAVVECLRLIGSRFKGVGKIVKKTTLWAIERLSSYNERQAKAEKIRIEGEALLIQAKAEADLTKAQARKERAEAKEQELKNETAAELLKQLKERAIVMHAEIRDGHLYIAVVKDEPKED